MIHHRDTLKEISGDLIKHLLGFQPGDPNFNRSIQYVCSNLFYHRCLSPEPRQLQEQVDGVLLKLAVHGRAGNRDRLEKLVKEWTAIPEAHEQRELRWSLLCLLLELSFNPTSHHVSPSPSSNHHISPSPSSNHVSQSPAETQRSGSRIEANLLQQLLPDTLPPLLPDEPLSDWSDADEEPEDGNTKNLEFGTAAGNVNFLPHGKTSSVTSTFSSSHASTCEPSVNQANTATHDKSRVGNGVSVTAADSKASQPVISNEAEALICDNLSSAELLKEASRARQWLDANTRQTVVDCYGVERVSEEELVIRLLQSLFCPSLFRSLLDQTPATPTLNQERVESVLQKNFRPMIEKLEDIEKTFTGLYARKNIGIADFRGEKTTLHTEEKLNSNSAFHERVSDFHRNSNVGVKIPYECSAKSSLREAFIAALSEWQARVYQKLEEFVNFVRDGKAPATLLWLVSALEPVAETVTVVHNVLLLQQPTHLLQQSTHLLQQPTHLLQQPMHLLQQPTHLLQQPTHLLQHQEGQLPNSQADPGKDHLIAEDLNLKLSTHRDALWDLRLLGALLHSLDTCCTAASRSLLLQLLMRTLQPLLHALLQHPAETVMPSIVYRDFHIDVRSLQFWDEAYQEPAILMEHIKQIPGLTCFLPIMETLHTTAKSRELVSALQLSSDWLRADYGNADHTAAVMRDDSHVDAYNVLLRHVQKLTADVLPHVSRDDPLSDALQSALSLPDYDPFLLNYNSRGSEQPSSNVAHGDNIHNGSFIHEPWLGEVHASSPVCSGRLLQVVARAADDLHAAVTERLSAALYDNYALGEHISALCSVMLLQPSNILKGFTAALLEKDFLCETINTAYLTTELRDCLEKVHPKVASLFSVVARKPSTCSCQSTPGTLTPMSGASYSGNKKPCAIHPQMNSDPQSLNVGMNSRDYELLREFFDDEELKLLDLSGLGAQEAKDLSHVCIVYAGRWPWSAVLPADIVQHYNSVLHFCFRLQQPLHVLHALNFKDMRTYEVVASAPADCTPDDGPLRSRLLRLQLLRHWLLHFCRALHDHFTTVVILPFKHALHQLLSSRPPLQHFLTEHARLVTELRQRCLLSGGDSESPAQLALKQVVWVVQEVGGAWRRGGCGQAELCRLEASYAACHRFLLRLITALAKTADQYQHLTALATVLGSSCPINV